MRGAVPFTAILALLPAVWGQAEVSARSGLIQYAEGRVRLDNQEVAAKVNEFPQMKNGQTLATEEGRVEVLLTPGAFLRLSENSSFRMASSSLSDTRIEVLSGSTLVEVDELFRDNSITLRNGGAAISLRQRGLYRVDAEGAGRLRVYDGEVGITSAGRTITATTGHAVKLAEPISVSKFDIEKTDPFYRWSARRAGYIATANIASARSILPGSPGNRAGAFGNWVYNPWFGMFTFMPTDDFGYSPYQYDLQPSDRQFVYCACVRARANSCSRQRAYSRADAFIPDGAGCPGRS
jgi:hypothetical protein